MLPKRIKRLQSRMAQIDEIVRRVDDLQKAVGRIEKRLAMPERKPGMDLREYEFKVFSQWGEDGIIQFLIHHVAITSKTFIEFGVQDYRESNTRFLLQNDNWTGLVIDAASGDIERIKQDPIYYRNDLRAVCAFIDRDNINSIISDNGFSGDIGLLSIDIDGNDYWVWEAITCVSPSIVVCEYDSLLGSERSLSTPYDKHFERTKAHYSFLYGGASIAAMHRLGVSKGYSLVGSNSAGNNLFFVRSDLAGGLRVLTPREAYVKARFRNSKDMQGNLTFLGFDDARKVIAHLPVFDFEQDRMITIRDILPAS